MRYIRFGLEISTWGSCGLISLLLLQLGAYWGILDDAATNTRSSGALVGGAWLDMLGLVVLVQFGTLISGYFYYLLLALPVVSGWKLYKMFGGGPASRTSSTPDSDAQDDTKEKRNRRAEKRRQKWT